MSVARIGSIRDAATATWSGLPVMSFFAGRCLKRRGCSPGLGGGFNAANAVVLFHDTANSNTLSMYYTEYLDDSAGTTTQLATFDSVTTVSQIDNMTASDFDVQA